jgi:hypothetical protein
MFRWACLAVAVVFLALLTWMVNDVRLHVRQSGETVQTMGETVNEHLPNILERVHTTTDTLAELAADIRQLKELAGVTTSVRDQNLVAYANSVVSLIERSGGIIGLKKKLGGKGLKNESPAKEWAAGARKEALLLTILARSKKELVMRLANNKFGSSWYIRFGEGEPVELIEWLKDNHPQTKAL